MKEGSPNTDKTAPKDDLPAIYFNHGATSHPKPKKVRDLWIESALNKVGTNRGIAQRFSMDDCRQTCADFLGVDKNCIIFTAGCTMACNLGIMGYPLKDGDHVVYSSIDHHATMRPCRLREKLSGGKIKSHMFPCPGGFFDLEKFEAYLVANPVKLVCIVHCANVIGVVNPVVEIGKLCKKHGSAFLLDTAQSAGHFPLPIDLVDMAAFAGHKGLNGMAGSGFLYKASHVDLAPLMVGGTGGDSGKFDIGNYKDKPVSYEVGTQPLPLFITMAAGIRHVMGLGVENVHKREWALFERLMKGLREMPELVFYGMENANSENHTATVCLNVKGIKPKCFEQCLLQNYNVTVRAGFHCSSCTHWSIGTLQHEGAEEAPEFAGAVRVSLGYTNTEAQVDRFIKYTKEIIAKNKKAKIDEMAQF